jgi:hypothetical protein
MESSEVFYIYSNYRNPKIVDINFEIEKLNGKLIGFSIYTLKTKDNQDIKIIFDTSFTLGYLEA